MKQETPRYKVILIKKFSENIALQKGYWNFWVQQYLKKRRLVNEDGDVDRFELFKVLWYRNNIKIEATAYILVCFKLVYNKRYVTWL